MCSHLNILRMSKLEFDSICSSLTLSTFYEVMIGQTQQMWILSECLISTGQTSSSLAILAHRSAWLRYKNLTSVCLLSWQASPSTTQTVSRLQSAATIFASKSTTWPIVRANMLTDDPFNSSKTRQIISDYSSKTTAPPDFRPSFVHIASPGTKASFPCNNCGHAHPRLHDASPANCFFITIRRSGRDRIPLSTPHSVGVRPTTNTASFDHQLRDYIWDEFDSLKAEVDLDRDQIALQRSPHAKGQLKEKAPLPWLAWVAPDGRSGQTRNRANFFAIWDKIMSASVRRNRQSESLVLVSSVLISTSHSRESPVPSPNNDAPGVLDQLVMDFADQMVLYGGIAPHRHHQRYMTHV